MKSFNGIGGMVCSVDTISAIKDFVDEHTSVVIVIAALLVVNLVILLWVATLIKQVLKDKQVAKDKRGVVKDRVNRIIDNDLVKGQIEELAQQTESARTVAPALDVSKVDDRLFSEEGFTFAPESNTVESNTVEKNVVKEESHPLDTSFAFRAIPADDTPGLVDFRDKEFKLKNYKVAIDNGNPIRITKGMSLKVSTGNVLKICFGVRFLVPRGYRAVVCTNSPAVDGRRLLVVKKDTSATFITMVLVATKSTIIHFDDVLFTCRVEKVNGGKK